MNKEDLVKYKHYYYVEPLKPESVSDLLSLNKTVPHVLDVIYTESLYRNKCSSDEKGWFRYNSNGKKRICLREEDIQRYVFESRLDADKFWQSHLEECIMSAEDYIERLTGAKRACEQELKSFDDLGPLFAQIERDEN